MSEAERTLEGRIYWRLAQMLRTRAKAVARLSAIAAYVLEHLARDLELEARRAGVVGTEVPRC